MRNTILTTMLALISFSAFARNSCTDQPKDKWMKESDFKNVVEGQGYKINKFNQPGSCYEIYGLNKEGKKVEVYFNPVNASVVKEEND